MRDPAFGRPDSTTSSNPNPWFTAGLTALLALSFFTFPETIAAADLDPSWVQSLGHFFKNRRQIGVDYIFTYGPFGFFIHRTYDADLFWISYAWEVVLKSLCAFVIVWVIMHARNRGWSLLLLVVAAIVFEPGVPEALLNVALLASFISIARQTRHSLILLLPVAGLIALISLVKFTFFVYVVAALPFVEFAYRRKHPRVWLSPLVCCVAAVMGLWVAAGQSLWNFPRYVYGSLQIAAGYSEAMAYPAGSAELALGVAVAVVLALLIVAVAIWPRLDAERVAGLVIFGACLFLTWKHGFTRGDPVHNAVYFLTAMFLAGFVPIFFAPQDAARTVTLASAGGCMIICLMGLEKYTSIRELVARRPHILKENLVRLINPNALHEQLESQFASLERRWQLPAIRERIGDSPVDLFSFEQGVILLNRLNYVSRPVLHSYSAYRHYLLAANAQFLRSAAAPMYILYRFSTINKVFPSLPDSAAFLELFWRYRPVLGERSFILCEKCAERPHDNRPVGKVVDERTIQFDQRIDMSGVSEQFLTMSFEFKPTTIGRLKDFFSSRGRVMIQLDFDNGESLQYRLTPAIAGSEFLFRPFVAERNDVLNLYGGVTGKTIRAFRLIGNDPGSYAADIEMTTRAYPQMVGCPIDSQLLAKLRSQPEEIRVFEGALDTADSDTIAGWVIEKNVPDEPVNVDIFLDDTLVAVIPASESKPGIGNHGFVLPSPDILKDGRPHKVRVQPAGSSQQLRGSPKTYHFGR